jgi:hypothetical protein
MAREKQGAAGVVKAYFLYIELGVAALCLVLAAGTGFRFGGLASKTALEGLRADQAQLTATAVLAERASEKAESDRLTKVISDYEKTPIDPIAIGVARRVFIYANAPGCPVSKAGPDPDGTVSAAPVAIGPSSIEQRLDDYVQACDADAKELAAIQAAWRAVAPSQ